MTGPHLSTQRLLLAACAFAALAAGSVRAAPPPGPPQDVQVSADSVSYEGGTERIRLEGHAVVRRGSIVLRASHATFDRATNEVVATGGVLLTDRGRVVAADALRAVIGGEYEAQGVLAFVKDEPLDLSQALTAGEAARTGRNRLSFSGARLEGTPDGRFRLGDARLTLCDCPGGAPPSWELRAREADVIPGKRAILRGTVVRITPRFLLVERPVPVLYLPWLYLPLGERQSGLLLPTIESTGATGLTIAEPLYLTLGRSADLTLTPEYAFGPKRSKVVTPGERAVRGPGARLELRWAASEGSSGRAELATFDDLDAEPGGAHGGRWALWGDDDERLGAATNLHATLRLAGDPVWVRDFYPDVLVRSVPYRRSDVLVSRRGDAVVLEAGATYDEPLFPLGVPAGAQWGTLGAGERVASRWPGASAALLPTGAGPALVSGGLGVSRYAPVADVLDVLGRPAATRGDARLEVAAPLLLGEALSLTPWIRGAALGYSFEGSQAARADAWGVAGATLETEVSRGFGAVRHAVAPRLEWRAGSGVAGDPLEVPAYDAFDRTGAGLLTASPGPFQQLRGAVATRLDAGGKTLLRAELGQDLDLREGRWAETFAAAAVAAGPVQLDARARFFGIDRRPEAAPAPRVPSRLDDFTELRASVALADGRGDALRAGFFAVGPGGSGTLVAGLDPLFDLRPAAIDAAASATAGIRAAIGGAKLGYDVLLPGRAAYVRSCHAQSDADQRRVEAWQPQQHAATLSWESPCRCFRIVARGSIDDCGVYSYGASIELSRLSVGTVPGR